MISNTDVWMTGVVRTERNERTKEEYKFYGPISISESEAPLYLLSIVENSSEAHTWEGD